MYNVVLMMALTGSGEVPDCHRHNCYGGCQGTVVVSGCTGTVVSTSGYGCRGGCVGTYVTSGGCVGTVVPAGCTGVVVNYGCNGCHGGGGLFRRHRGHGCGGCSGIIIQGCLGGGCIGH